eukprot:2582975-Amphidinium_carterae.1
MQWKAERTGQGHLHPHERGDYIRRLPCMPIDESSNFEVPEPKRSADPASHVDALQHDKATWSFVRQASSSTQVCESTAKPKSISQKVVFSTTVLAQSAKNSTAPFMRNGAKALRLSLALPDWKGVVEMQPAKTFYACSSLSFPLGGR